MTNNHLKMGSIWKEIYETPKTAKSMGKVSAELDSSWACTSTETRQDEKCKMISLLLNNGGKEARRPITLHLLNMQQMYNSLAFHFCNCSVL